MPKRKPKVIGIVGSRRRDSEEDWIALEDAFDKVYRQGDSLVSGGCPKGADRMAEELAKLIGLSILIHFPRKQNLDPDLLWSNPRAAYASINHARNSLIARDCDILIALVHEDRSGGTEDTVKKTLALGKRVVYA